MTKKNDPTKSAADYASVSLTTQCGSGPDATNLVVQLSVDITRGEQYLNGELDVMSRSLARQREIGNITSYEENIYNCGQQIRIFEEDISGMHNKAAKSWADSKRTGKPQLNPNDQQRERDLLKEVNRLKDARMEWENKLVLALELRDGKVAKAVKSA